MIKKILMAISLMILPACMFFVIGYIMGFFHPNVPRSSFYDYFLFMLPPLLFSGVVAGSIYLFASKRLENK